MAEQVRHERSPEKCANPDCDWTVIGKWVAEQMDRSIRDAKRIRAHGGNGYCNPCAARLRRNGTLERQPILGNPRTPPPPFPCGGGCGRMLAVKSVYKAATAAGNPNKIREHHGRGLCTVCYWRLYNSGELVDIETRFRRNAEVVEEYDLLRSQGVWDLKIIAGRMGMTYKALERALHRARKRGDTRAALPHRNLRGAS